MNPAPPLALWHEISTATCRINIDPELSTGYHTYTQPKFLKQLKEPPDPEWVKHLSSSSQTAPDAQQDRHQLCRSERKGANINSSSGVSHYFCVALLFVSPVASTSDFLKIRENSGTGRDETVRRPSSPRPPLAISHLPRWLQLNRPWFLLRNKPLIKPYQLPVRVHSVVNEAAISSWGGTRSY